MKYKLFTYDILEYKQFEDKLNTLSKEGLNPVEMGYLSKFEQNNKHYVYTVDVLKIKDKKPRKQIQYDLMNLYGCNGYDYIGKRGNAIFFRSESKRQLPKGRKEIREEYLKNRWVFSTFVFFVFASIAVYYVGYLLANKDINQYLTNGEVILHWIPALIVIAILCLVFVEMMHAFQYKAKRDLLSSNFRLIGIILILVSIVCIPVGCIMDATARGDEKADGTMLSLGDFNLEDSKDGTYSYASSYLVDAKTYLEENSNEDIIYSGVYALKDTSDLDAYYETFKQSHLEDKYEEVQKDVYVYTIDLKNDAMIAKIDNKMIEVTTTFDLKENNNYQKVIDFYSK